MKNNILLLLIMSFLMKSTEIEISISEQKLFLLDNKSVIKTYLIFLQSTERVQKLTRLKHHLVNMLSKEK